MAPGEIGFCLAERAELQSELSLVDKKLEALRGDDNKDKNDAITNALREAKRVLVVEYDNTGGDLKIAPKVKPDQSLFIPGTPSQRSNTGKNWKPTDDELDSFSEVGSTVSSPCVTPAQRIRNWSSSTQYTMYRPSPSRDLPSPTPSRYELGRNIFQTGKCGTVSFPPMPSQRTTGYEPATPSTSRNAVDATLALTGPAVPGTTIIADGPPLALIIPGQKFSRYIVYISFLGGHALVKYWKPSKSRPGVACGAPLVEGFEDAVWKGFTDSDRAQQYYNDCKKWKIFDTIVDFLKEKQQGRIVYLIVTKGINPGVYDDHKDLVHRGLAYRGGQVHIFVGSKTKALAQFSEFERRGEVEKFEGIEDGDL
ncbi:hypothetical protein V5O48_017326 [Marasmius crinis-equi]|uniref:Uncharacterized protein n=1 Tax=Marasmius crinis-equi TaxID=585013 RepID=A0ABR3EP99_9AGAR